MSIASFPSSPPVAWPDLRSFTVDEYHQMIRAGILNDAERVELIEGRVLNKMTHNPIHDMTVDSVQEALRDRLSKAWRVRVQSAITTADSEPEPDIVIAQGPAKRYANRHPGPRDIVLLVEVADSSLDRDRNVKGPLYARAGIPVYWIVNLPESVIEIHTNPTGPAEAARYQTIDRLAADAEISLAFIDPAAGAIHVRDLLP